LEREVGLYESIDVQAIRDAYWKVALGDADIETEYTPMTYRELLAEFQPYPDKCDMMVVVAHPDDEGYLGGLLTHYTRVRKKKIVVVCLTSGEWGNGMPHHKAGQKPDYSYDDAEYQRYEKVPTHHATLQRYVGAAAVGRSQSKFWLLWWT
jgi:hypothetical protein